MSDTIFLGGRCGQVNDLSLALARHQRDAAAPTEAHLLACPVRRTDARTHGAWHEWAASLLSVELAHAQETAPPAGWIRNDEAVTRRRMAEAILSDPASTAVDRDVARRYLTDDPNGAAS